jgi:hypothetical protein
VGYTAFEDREAGIERGARGSWGTPPGRNEAAVACFLQTNGGGQWIWVARAFLGWGTPGLRAKEVGFEWGVMGRGLGQEISKSSPGGGMVEDRA